MENSATTATTPGAVGVRYGLLTGLISIIFSFALFALKQDQSPLRNLAYLMIVAGIVLAQIEFKRRDGGFMSYGEGLKVGLVVSAVAGVLSAVFTYVYLTFIDPEAITRALDKARADLEAKGAMGDAEIDQAMSMIAKFSSAPVLAITTIFLTVLFGLAVSLISSAVIKNNRPEFE